MMRISFAPYERPLKTPFSYGGKTVFVRSGACLRLEGPRGVYFSEASPLPGHSLDSMDSVIELLENNSILRPFLEFMDHGFWAAPLLPSLSFALEDLALQAKDAPKAPQGKIIETNALVPWHGAENTLLVAKEKIQAGHSTLKFKIIDKNREELFSIFQELLKLRIPTLRFRLDANGTLSEPELKDLFSRLSLLPQDVIEYLEEPFRNWDLPLLAASPVPLAADESANNFDPLELLENKQFVPSVFILKPTVQGGKSALEDRVKKIEGIGRTVVFSSALEVEPGRRGILRFLFQQKELRPAGLCTGFLFSQNFLPDCPKFFEVPPISAAEQAWLDSLNWRDCHG